MNSTSRVQFYDVASADSARLRTWTNGVEGPPTLLSTGLGTSLHSWPGLLDPACGDLTGARDMKSAAKRIQDARYLWVDATHSVPIEQPRLVLDVVSITEPRW